MNTPHVTEKLPLWVSGELSKQEMNSVQAHLDSCSVCKSEALAYSEALSWLQTPSEHPFTAEERVKIRNKAMADIRHIKLHSNEYKPVKSNVSSLEQFNFEKVNCSKQNALRRAMPWLLTASASLAAVILYNLHSAKKNLEPKFIAAVSQPDNPTVNQQAQQIITAQPDAELTPSILEKTVYEPVKRRIKPPRAKSQSVGLERELTVTRIEFYLKDPNIRVIWVTKTNPSTKALSGDSNGQPI
ncbi:MAG: zf-HC2 domain-containing protein [Holophagales bacterium]|jgi:anti-sigma factor RsiW|nr:zf-HC2 domain-containing protein [Holophagales bacterium]